MSTGEGESAQAILQRIIDKDSNSMEAHLLMSKIQLHHGNVKQCSTALENALSSNFQVSFSYQSCCMYSLAIFPSFLHAASAGLFKRDFSSFVT
jgi:lipopolysaccharide biosynthesis regulator YciM